MAVFRECRRVLADHGTLWVEIGDSSTPTVRGMPADAASEGASTVLRDDHTPMQLRGQTTTRHPVGGHEASTTDLKPKDLIGQPWLLAFALRADGWYLRSEIIWARPNPMPESVTDRPTKATRTVFLLSKQPRYFYDADAIREAPCYALGNAATTCDEPRGYGTRSRHQDVRRRPPSSRP